MSETFFAKFIKAHPQYSEMAQSFKDPSVFTQEILLEHARQIDTNPSLATFLYDSYEKQGLRPIVLTALVKFARNFVDVERLNYMNRWESFLGDYIEQLNVKFFLTFNNFSRKQWKQTPSVLIKWRYIH